MSNKHDAIAARALAALKRVALRDDSPALALRGIAMAQLGDLGRARDLLHRAARRFGDDPAARARCRLAAAEIALVTRDLGGLEPALDRARVVLAAQGDRANAAHAACLLAPLLLLTGRLDQAEAVLAAMDAAALPSVSHPARWLVVAGIAMRRISAGEARAAFDAPAARLIKGGRETQLDLAGAQALIGQDMLLVDACCATARPWCRWPGGRC